METLRDLLLQRAARLQDRPALTAPGWGTLSWTAWRNRVEGVGIGLLSSDLAGDRTVHAATGGPWDWACEVAAACCGLRWEAGGTAIDPTVLGGIRFNDHRGRGPYHERERIVTAATPFLPGLSHGELLLRLRRLNATLGWDHDTRVAVGPSELPTTAGRAALWSLLYAGGHAVLTEAAGDPGGRDPSLLMALRLP